ncbi:hypothetical protein [Parafilimonas terrae]|uniref:Uncharacterized protein n=1 Tax=Parafilimonas terrae TaxID=1465490 RepID=A0A1I5U1N8_9BACT|nr:hypothetical protein [Parafilimonas terrae]SFP89081.1 hypothetical protein SAMN05444277_1034 [Parafilimonas terrae]
MENLRTNFNLSEKEIQSLFRFVEKKSVRWYDLQIEIVDHLASSIEDEISLIPGISFESALENVYKGFGIFGFAKIVEERQNHLAKAVKKRWWSEIKNMFKWPEIALSILIVSGLSILSKLLQHSLEIYFYIIYFGIISIPMISVLQRKNVKKPLLLLEKGSMYMSVSTFFQFFIIPFSLRISPLLFVVLLFITTLFEMATFKTYISIRKKAEALYPAAFN